jgi:hypothetical protein
MQSGPHPPEWSVLDLFEIFHDTDKATTIIVSSIFEPLHGIHIGKNTSRSFHVANSHACRTEPNP